MEFVLNSAKSHVWNVVALKHTIANQGIDRMTHQFKKHLAAKVNKNRLRLERIREYEMSLDNNLLYGITTKAEYNILKASYTDEAEILIMTTNEYRAKLMVL